MRLSPTSPSLARESGYGKLLTRGLPAKYQTHGIGVASFWQFSPCFSPHGHISCHWLEFHPDAPPPFPWNLLPVCLLDVTRVE